ncbi:BrnA antitoxin family protein [Bosea psychrotolerans]|uniref:BrnA antitoxin of type II toxin-antitoxin system n=1 Tax=Bosea psychrotolerans TaxID=1871628 RepID=A0A2S4LRW9_9HYPH|nr:BrnA antitoxin family protein [Bosea psychrotolerans]POR45202.1 BrnA antitoxin of type II toxin-antitoxin system [Bosea psychrotolerans]
MSQDRPRRPVNLRDKAEALFKPAAPKVPAPAVKRPAIPGTREMVSLRIDSEVLEHFQSGGPGWQDRINDALRQAAGIGSDDEGLTPDELNSSNDG